MLDVCASRGRFLSQLYQPPFSITPAMATLVGKICEAVGRLTVLTDQAKSLRLRRINRIHTIRGSLAIKGNQLSEHRLQQFSTENRS